jgi:sulfur-carrier protein
VITVKVHTILDIKKIIGKGEVEIPLKQGSTVQTLLETLLERWGKALADAVFEPESTRLFPYIRLMVNGRDIAFLNGLETVLREQDEILLLPPVSGG